MLWSASGLDPEASYKIGQTFNLQCPDGLKISHDNDTYNAWDDVYTISCTPLLKYTISDYWPTCVQSCKLCLPNPPERTGLVPVQPKNTIPVGGYGQYICLDTTLGIDEVRD